MTETKFTPGPWGLAKAIDVWVMAGGVHVATIPRAHDGDWSPANANLIAAAPELYEALAEIDAWSRRQNIALPSPAIYAALSKAEGHSK